MSEALLPKVPAGDTKFRLVGATLIDGTGTDPLNNAEIEVNNDRIVYVGPTRDESPNGVETIDVKGATVLPGFIDTHIHAGMSIEIDPEYKQRRHSSEWAVDAAMNLRDTLNAGVTTARDLGGLDAGFRYAIADGKLLGPRLHLALTALSPTGGHNDFHMENGVYDNPGLGPMNSIIDTDDEVRKTVRLLVRTGADVIKVSTSGGVSSPTDQPDDVGVPSEHVKIIVEEMKKRDEQPVASHAQGAQGILEALRGGVASIEHGYGIDDEGIKLMLEQGTFLVPTLSSALRVPDPDNVPDFLYEKKVVWSATARENVARAIKAGVRVALGTDAGICPHGLNLKELGHMVELGLTPMEAIVAGTKNASELLRLQDELGTLEEGKLADIVITQIDPLTDIDVMAEPDNIHTVIQGGRIVKNASPKFAVLPAAGQVLL